MAGTEFTLYPNQIDSYASMPLRIDQVHEIVAADHNRLRNAIIAIEQELGVAPSGAFATVRARLDDIGNSSALIESHLVDSIDAHDASAISILDTADNYTSTDVEGALGELAAVLPADLDVIGQNQTDVPNTGVPNFVSGDGSLHVFNTSGGADVLVKTQPVTITGVHIIEVGDDNGSGTAQLRLTNHSPATVAWKAPGDSSFGTGVDISGLAAGEVATLSSDTATKQIRIARSSVSLPVASPLTEDFDVFKLDAGTGTFSILTDDFVDSNFITRTSVDATGTSRNQFMIGGMVYPADKGTLVLQRKLRSATDFIPIATLDLSANFDEDLRATGQLVYVPTLADYDVITLFDRLPARNDYETLDLDADGDAVYSNFDVTNTFSSFQVAKYLIPVSNPDIANATLEAPTDFTLTEIESTVSSYRLVHYRPGVTDFTGEPAAADIFSVVDALGAVDDGDNNVRMSNVFLDTNITRPNVAEIAFRPELDAEVSSKIVSGIHYYNSSSDLFDIEIKSDANIFTNAYSGDDILRFTTDVFNFTGEDDGYGLNIEVENLLDDGYSQFSSANLPIMGETAFYIANLAINQARRVYPDTNKFSTQAYINATFYDPFGPGVTTESTGTATNGTVLRMFVNSYSTARATDTIEYFTDESYRVGTSEEFVFALDADQFTYEDGAGANGTLANWDETVPLSAGELQCGGLFDDGYTTLPGLVLPQENYTAAGIRPTQQSGVDYSVDAYQTNSYYHRLFSLGYTTNGGSLRVKSVGQYPIAFNDIAEDNDSRPVKIEVKIPGTGDNSTGWLDIGKFFKSGKYQNDDGALSGPITGSSGDLIIPFTFGERNTADTNFMIAVRITYFGSTQLSDAQTRIISYVELLP